MLHRRATVGGEVVVVACADDVAPHADWLLEYLKRLSASGHDVKDGVRFQIGGCFLSLRRLAFNELAVCAPDVDADPFRDETADLSISLRTLIGQMRFTQELGVEPIATSFQDKIVLDEGCLESADLFMIRSAPTDGDSGWFLGRQGPRESAPPMEAIFAFELMKRRPELAPAMVLPAGFLVMVNARGILSVVDEQGQTRFTSNDR